VVRFLRIKIQQIILYYIGKLCYTIYYVYYMLFEMLALSICIVTI